LASAGAAISAATHDEEGEQKEHENAPEIHGEIVYIVQLKVVHCGGS